MLRIKWSKSVPGGMEIHHLKAGDVFKTRKGSTPYIAVCLGSTFSNVRGIRIDDTSVIFAVSLESGQLHSFERNHPVVELEGDVELSKKEAC